ncbi:MAG: hypothetical protein JWO36_2329 [Myxococcales bacterium]|nr:hypothetical protein [Myxococcales bacterium]
MAKRKRKEGPTPAVTPLPSASSRTRDVRPFIYYGLGQLFAVGYAYVISAVIPNRLPSAQIHLWSIPVCTQVMALGMLGILGERTRKLGWWTSVGAGSLLLLSTIVLIVRILVSAAFLAGVYGAFGQAAASFALIAVALIVEVVALLPIVQIKYLMSRTGRRVFGLA